MSKHKPTPWFVGLEYGDGGGRARVIRSANLYYVLNESGYISAENAAFIVRAVNAHEGLVTALEAVIESINDGDAQSAINAARAALSAAKE